MATKNYPEWIWDSYESRPKWAEEATIHEWASRVQQVHRADVDPTHPGHPTTCLRRCCQQREP